MDDAPLVMGKTDYFYDIKRVSAQQYFLKIVISHRSQCNLKVKTHFGALATTLAMI
jgi:hypothetical protein